MGKNLKVIITGGSRGIGAAAVKLFTEKGNDVAFIYNRSEERAKGLSKQFGALAIKGDVSVPGEADRATKEAIRGLNGVDVLINNAGISQFKVFGDITNDDWQRMLDTNLGGVFYCTRAVLPEMIINKSGKIVNISSIWGVAGASCEVHYSAAKAGIIGLTKALAKELGPSGITVNCVAPGVIETEMNSTLDEDALNLLMEETPLGRMGTTEEVAELIYFLSSDKANFITGQVISPNGGFVI